MMSMWTLRSLAVLSAFLILEASRCSTALPKSWMGPRPDEVLPDEEPAPKIEHSAAAAAAQDLMDQLDTSDSLDDLLDNGDSSDEVEESMQNLETPALKTREYNPVDPPYGKEPTYGQDPKPYRQNPEPYNPDPEPYNPNQDPYNPNPEPYNPNPEPYNPNPEPYNPDPKPYGKDPYGKDPYGKDPYCRTYYDYVYDKKCKDYTDKVCYTTYTEYCDDVDKDSCKAVMKKNEVRKCYNVEELLCGLVETVKYEIVQARHTIQKCYPVKERVCDTVYESQLNKVDDYQCVNLKTYYCNKKDKTLYDKTCRHVTKYDCKYDSYGKGYGSEEYEESEYETKDKYAVDSYGKTEGYGETGNYGKTGGYDKTDYSYKEPNCTYKTEVKCYETPRTVTTLDCYDKYEKECKKMPEEKPYPVEKQACHDDEKKVCEQKEISEPKQVKKYVYKKECKKVPREICSTATYKSLEPYCTTSTYKNCYYKPDYKCMDVPKEYCYKVQRKIKRTKCDKYGSYPTKPYSTPETYTTPKPYTTTKTTTTPRPYAPGNNYKSSYHGGYPNPPAPKPFQE